MPNDGSHLFPLKKKETGIISVPKDEIFINKQDIGDGSHLFPLKQKKRHQYDINSKLSENISPKEAGEVLDLSDKSGFTPELVQSAKKEVEAKVLSPPTWQEIDRAVMNFGSKNPHYNALIKKEVPVWDAIIKNWNELSGFIQETTVQASKALDVAHACTACMI